MPVALSKLIAEAVSTKQPASTTYMLSRGEDSPVVDTTARPVTNAVAVPSSDAPTRLRDTHQGLVPCGLSPKTAQQTLMPIAPQKWISVQPKSWTSKELITLADDSYFSVEFDKAIGVVNMTDINCIDDQRISTEIFASLCEQEAWHYMTCGHIGHAGSVEVQTQIGCFKASADSTGTLRWRSSNGQVGTTLIDLLRMAFNLSRPDAIATLAGIVRLDFSNLLTLSSEMHVAETKGTPYYSDNVPKQIPLHNIPEVASAELVDLHYILGNAGQVIGAVALYRLADRRFCLPATVVRGRLCVGKCKPTAYFLNQHLMGAQPFTPILLCGDMRTALALQKLIDQIVPQHRPQVIVTGHLGTDLSVLPWNYFSGHDVIFICAPTKHGLAVVKAYQAQVLGASARSFYVSPIFLLHTKQGCDPIAPELSGLSDFEAELLGLAMLVENIERPVVYLQHLFEKARTYCAFVQWGMDRNIFKHHQKAAQTSHKPKALGLKWFNPDEVADFKQPANLQEVTVQHIVPAQGIVMLHGVKNAGKSNALFGQISSLVHGESAFGFFPTEQKENQVLLVDSETPSELFKARLQQHQLTGAIGRNFFPIRKTDMAALIDGSLVLTNPCLKKVIEHEIKERKISHFFVDNLTTLADPAKLYTQKLAAEVLDWARELGEQGVTTIIAHHSLDNDEKPESAAMRGSRELSIRAHTEIVIIGTDQVRTNASLGSPKVQLAAKGQGATIGLHFRYCKMACILEGHTVWFQLALNSEQWRLLDITNASGQVVRIDAPHVAENDEIPTYSDTAHPTPCTSAPSAVEPEGSIAKDNPLSEGLSEDEQAVMEFAKSEGKKVQTREIATHLQCGDTKARELLKALCDKGFLVSTGQGASAGYDLP